MAMKAKLLEATSEEDSCSGFEDNLINNQMKAMVSSEGVINLASCFISSDF